MCWQLKVSIPIALLALACGGPSAPLPTPRGKGGAGGNGGEDVTYAGASTAVTRGGATGQGGSGEGGTISTYVDPGCPNVVEPEIDAQCSVEAQTGCAAGDGCYPTVTYPSGPCEPEIYHMQCAPAGSGVQWDPCLRLVDCAPGYICVVGGLGTECQRACNINNPTASCPKGLFCEAIDMQGIGTCD